MRESERTGADFFDSRSCHLREDARIRGDRLQQRKIAAMRTARPPSTPPAIAPLLTAEDEGVGPLVKKGGGMSVTVRVRAEGIVVRGLTETSPPVLVVVVVSVIVCKGSTEKGGAVVV